MNLVAMVLAARSLGAEGFGAFALVQSTLGLFGMFAGAALGAAATRFIAATHRTDPNRAGRIIGLVTGSALFSAVVFGVAIIAAAPWLSRTVLGSVDLASATALGALLVGLGVFRGVQDAILAGFEAFRRIAFLRFVEGSATLLLVPPLVAQSGPVGGIAALSLGLLVAFIPGTAFVHRELQERRVTLHWRNAIDEWRLLRDFSAPSLLASSVATPVLWACALILSRTPGGLAELGIYNAAYQWHGPLVFVPMVIASVTLPILTQTWTDGDHVSFRRLFLKVQALGVILAFIPAALVAALSPQIMEMYGGQFRSAEAVLLMLALTAPFHVASNIATTAVQSMNKSWYLPALHGIWGGTLLVLAVLLIEHRGAEGLALSFLASYVLLSTCKFLFVLLKSQN